MNYVLAVFYTCFAIFLINLPCGYFRAAYKKLSPMWFLFIHLPVPFVIYIRHFFGVELTWTFAPFLFGSYFLGQYLGRKIRMRFVPLDVKS
jgi:hypothetical protein